MTFNSPNHLPHLTTNLSQNPNSAFSNKENPLAICCVVNLTRSSLTYSSGLSVLSLAFQFHQVFISELLVLHSKEFNEVILLQI